ncbi:MAG TPA: cation:proton antiporter [Microvirga sp.]|jgi:CPA1 family monovalent cation:H+ antiporter
MSTYQFVALLLVVIGPVLALAKSTGAPPSLVLFGVGLASTALPCLPPLRVDPQLVLNLFLPPLVYASTVRVSWHLLRFTLVPGVVVGAVTVIATVALVAGAARILLLPGISWIAALLLGVVASVFDTRLFHEAQGRPHVPRAITDTLKARELVARLFILATFALVVENAGSNTPTALAVAEHYAFDIPAGLLVGVLIGRAVAFMRQQIDPAPIEIAVSIMTPYAASLAATALEVSGVAAITAAALVISTVRINRRTGAPISSSEARISAVAFWEEVSLITSSALFLLAGRTLPEALAGLGEWPLSQLLLAAAAVLLVVLAVQLALSYVTVLRQPIAGALAAAQPRGATRWAAAAIMAWSSTRSVIGLVIALSIPAALPDGAAFPERDLILVVTALVILGSVLLQGLTLRAFVQRSGLQGEAEQQREEETARRVMETANASPGRDHANGFDSARHALLRLRERNEIGDEVLVSMLRETDLTSRATEGDALPGAGPPNP